MKKWDVDLVAGDAEAVVLVCAENPGKAGKAALDRAAQAQVCWEGVPTGRVLIYRVKCLGEDEAPSYYNFKTDPGDFGWVTQKMFNDELNEIVASLDAVSLLGVPGVYEILAEHFNNIVLANLQQHRAEALANDAEQEAGEHPYAFLKDGDTCPQCNCNNVIEVGVMLHCAGSTCGFKTEKHGNHY